MKPIIYFKRHLIHLIQTKGVFLFLSILNASTSTEMEWFKHQNPNTGNILLQIVIPVQKSKALNRLTTLCSLGFSRTILSFWGTKWNLVSAGWKVTWVTSITSSNVLWICSTLNGIFPCKQNQAYILVQLILKANYLFMYSQLCLTLWLEVGYVQKLNN